MVEKVNASIQGGSYDFHGTLTYLSLE